MQQVNKPYEGVLITVEGGEGCGKTEICTRLATELEQRGYTVIQTYEPGGGSLLSESLREFLLNPQQKGCMGARAELFLFLAARVQHIEEKILPALRQGKIVICDRFNDSSIAYQGCARHLGKQYVETLCRLATEELEEPNCTLLLDLDPTIGMQRIQKQRKQLSDRLEQETLPFHHEVRQGYLHLANEHSDRITTIDASASLEEVINLCLLAIEPHLALKSHLNK